MAAPFYRPDQRPDVEVLVDVQWWPGELRGWWDLDDARVLNVSWRSGPGMTRLGTVAAERVRLAEAKARISPIVVRPESQAAG